MSYEYEGLKPEGIPLDYLLYQYILDPENDKKNSRLAIKYMSLGQTAAAISFFLRGAERTKEDWLAYDNLLCIGLCFDMQRNRDYTVKAMYREAMALSPTRPEAYYLLAKKLEAEKNYSESYLIAELGLKLTEEPYMDLIDNRIGYPGKWGLMFQKAVAAWWVGKGMESRKIFQTLVDHHWSDIDELHRKVIESNIVNLGSGPYEYAFRFYDRSMYDKLRYKFPGSEKIVRNFAQVYQDLFILAMTNGKRKGSFMEIGGADPWSGNNTALLEKEYGWRGISIEYDEKFIKTYKDARPDTVVLHLDALKIDYDELMSDYFIPGTIDYLQLDIEPARNTYECMLKIPFDKYKFRVITYEHDYYADVYRTYREKSREFLKSKGYVLVANDISPDGVCNFEDWWVHPDLVDAEILGKMKDISEGAKDATAYMLSGESTKSPVRGKNILNRE
jgi:tetratricopeptide (TPR) repeat protein